MSEPTARVADPLDTYEQYARWAVPPLMSRERWQGRREPCLRSVDGWCLTHSTGQGPAWFTGAAGRCDAVAP